MTKADKGKRKSLRVNRNRLWSRHMELAKIGAVQDTGSCRLALSDEDAAARDLFALWCREAGLLVRSDLAGNMFALRSGRDPVRPAVAMGSHLDTQPHGGRFDGISGVLAGLEVVETLNDANIETDAPLAVINWTNEEGVRFAPGLLGSSWYSGFIKDEALKNICSQDGEFFLDEIERIGWNGDMLKTDLQLDSFFELHIEQGPILELASLQVGVVTAVQGLCWLEVSVTGMNAHAGTTPLNARKDALLSSSAMLVELNKMGIDLAPDARVSVGRLKTTTDGPSTVVGQTDFIIDIRHPSEQALCDLKMRCDSKCHAIADTYGCNCEVSQRLFVPPVAFDEDCIFQLASAAENLNLRYKSMPSGALHDASNVAQIVPSAMIFVPCQDGISHNIAEYASPDDLAAGSNVLLYAALARANASG